MLSAHTGYGHGCLSMIRQKHHIGSHDLSALMLLQMADGATHSNMLPHTPKSIVKRHTAFRPTLEGAGVAVGVGLN